jgi:hypothetical protein
MILPRRPRWSPRSLVAALLFAGCNRSSEAPPPLPRTTRGNSSSLPSPPAAPRAVSGASAPAAATPPPAPLDGSRYPWLASPPDGMPPPVDALARRFPAPKGFQRVATAENSFGAWLRGLPLADPLTPVRSFKGAVLRDASHHAVAGVVALDVGAADLQQCADSIIRLHAEWRWSLGDRRMSYKAASGTSLPHERWARGERVVASGNTLSWSPSAAPSQDHKSFRKYLDMVFNWANTGALARDARPTPFAELRPGDFFVLPGSPGHAVLVLDLARAPDGRQVALLGQGFMPAQNFHVLRDQEGSPWFALRPEEGAVKTPFWDPFPWSSLRRLD